MSVWVCAGAWVRFFILILFFFFAQSLDEWQLIHEYDVIFLHIVVYCSYEFAFNWPIKMFFTKASKIFTAGLKLRLYLFPRMWMMIICVLCARSHGWFHFRTFLHFFSFLDIGRSFCRAIFFFWVSIDVIPIFSASTLHSDQQIQ